MPDTCGVCSGETVKDEELLCKKCHRSYHVECGTGLSDIIVALRTVEKLQDLNFKCPICNIGERNSLIHTVLTTNQLHNEGKRVQPLTVPDTNNTETTVNNDNVAAEVVTAAITPAAGPNANVAAVTPGAPVHTVQPSQNITVEGARHTLPPSLVREDLTPLHEHDESRAKKFSYLLNSFYRLPGHPNVFIGGDSHLTKLDGKEVDPDDDQVRVRSAGGLCIPALVHALAGHKRVYKKFKSVSWSVGTNDALHGDEQHCPDDRNKYLRLLYSESRRIFPGAKIYVILPFSGLRGVSQSFIDTLERDLKSACPDMVLLKPPSMHNKIGKSGLHANRSGRLAFIKFLRATLVKRKQRVFSSDSGRLRSNTALSQVTQGASTGFRVPNQLTAPPHPGVPPQASDTCTGLVNNIATKVMEILRCNSTENFFATFN